MKTTKSIATALKANLELAVKELNNSEYDSKKYFEEIGFKTGIKIAIYHTFGISSSLSDKETIKELNKIIES